MKKPSHKPCALLRLLTLAAILPLLAAMPACKTSEANYRAAYERAVTARDSSTPLDSTIYGELRRQSPIEATVVDGVTLPLRTQAVRLTPDSDQDARDNPQRPERVKPYNVVVAQFKQLFNARSMRQRLAQNGWPGATVAQTAEPLYYVIAAGAFSAAEAAEALRRVQADTAVLGRLKAPFPWVLRPTLRQQ